MQVGGRCSLQDLGVRELGVSMGEKGWVITLVKIPEHPATVSRLYMRVSFVFIWFCSIPND